jgi:hypothetical protein
MTEDEGLIYLREKIRQLEDSISRLRAEADVLNSTIARYELLLESAKRLLKDEIAKPSGEMALDDLSDISNRIELMSFTDAIELIVRSANGPIHADQVLKQLRDAGKVPGAKNPKNSIVSLLHRGVERGVYKKVGPNLFVSKEE